MLRVDPRQWEGEQAYPLMGHLTTPSQFRLSDFRPRKSNKFEEQRTFPISLSRGMEGSARTFMSLHVRKGQAIRTDELQSDDRNLP